MPPRTRNTRKKAVELAPTMKRMMEVKNSELIFNNDEIPYSSDTLNIFSEFYEAVDKIADNVTAKYKPMFDVKEVLQKYLKDIPRDFVPNLETKEEIKNETMDLLETEVESLEDMEIGVASNRTEDWRGIRSQTLTSSEDDLDNPSISDAITTQLEEMSIVEDLELNIPLLTSTPIKTELSLKIDDEQLTTDGIKINSEQIKDVNDLETTGSVVEIVEKKEVEESKPRTLTTTDKGQKEGSTVLKSSKLSSPIPKASSTVSPHQYSNRNNLHTPRTTDIRLRTPKVDPTKLHTTKKENRGSDSHDSKMAHANELRSKLLLLKKEKIREDNERKASEVLERKKALEEQKMKQKSSSRHGASLKRTETLAGGQGPNKKTRVHLFPKEDKASVLDTSDVVVLTHSVKKQEIGFTTNSNKMTSHRGVCRENTTSDYGLDDLNSDEDTDDENNPRNEIPMWAEFSFVKRSVREHIENPPFDLDEFFGKIEKPNLQEIFGKIIKAKLEDLLRAGIEDRQNEQNTE
ncbi:Protein CBG12411 [Caenorhabditis briggsae]|uniref:Protein CBG12411 n=1 Tax=Caenorhabditis briggsae TaxID=6238 RepID=A8XFD3_CAEBR|nr:Protein CBG12411 [Caenorhabditis briggsae]CAP31394.2 Protein CBG12411 [Caenorhabditis briggsae]